ncbi:uncharacterized protein LOC121418046 [Lytechinus variegatus]|uniref:uncharacterized protein LOC121418046 n=1 Tax=Lytechinus variegatus TaxID=7654 RepID=UPI001BB1D244|nr:uncharacterized protein LOC121418046 [Lytechinus variegatus]
MPKRRAVFDTPEQLHIPFDQGVQAPGTNSDNSDSGSDEDDLPERRNSERPPIQKAIDYFISYRYLEGVRALSKVSPNARKALIVEVTEMIKNEIKVKPKIKSFQQQVNHSTVSSFSWEKAMEAQQSLPATVSCIWAMLPLNGENKKYAGQMLNIALYTKCRSYKFVQSCVGIELWKQRVSHKVFKTLNHMGISQSVGAARHNVDIIGKQHDKELWNWKKSLEKRQAESPTTDYGFCCDNFQIGTEGKSQRTGHSNTFVLEAMCFAVKDRVMEEATKVQVPAAKLDPYTFLPSPDVFERQRSRAIFLVKHLITKHLTKLQHLKKEIPSRILHSHTKEMDEKSQCVTLGAVDADPGSTQGMITVMEHLQKYVPVVEDQQTPCLARGVVGSESYILYVDHSPLTPGITVHAFANRTGLPMVNLDLNHQF